MKYTTAMAMLIGLLSMGIPHRMQSSASTCATLHLDEALFIQIARDMELLNSWLIKQDYPPESISKICHQNQQAILALYKVDEQTYQASITYYLTSSLERALESYGKLYIALQKVLPSR